MMEGDRRKHPSRLFPERDLRVGIVTRGDVFPPVHGAAAKIVATAESLSHFCGRVALVTDDPERWWRFIEGKPFPVPYPERLQQVPSWSEGRRRLLRWMGVPLEDDLLFAALLNPNFWARTVHVARAERLGILQAEFPFYGTATWIARWLTGASALIMQHNIEHLRIRETGGLDDRAAGRIRRLESFLCRRAQGVVALSEPDRGHLVRMGVSRRRISIIPHGVHVGSYTGPPRFDARIRYGISPDDLLLVYHGTLHYPPNLEAVRLLVDEILPEIRRRGYPARLLLCGMNPPPDCRPPEVIATGVVEDLASHLRAADVAVVPLRRGGGTRMKILEYFAAGIPVVSTRKGAEGIEVSSGREILLADEVGDIVSHILYLHHHPAARARIGAAGRSFVERYDWLEIGRRYVEAYGRRNGTARNGSGRPAGDRRNGAGRAPSAEARENLEFTRLLLSHLRDGEAGPPPPPQTLILMLNRGCNLSCAFCEIPGSRRPMALGDAKRVLAQARTIGARAVVLTGGEPFLHPDLFEIVRFARGIHLGTNVTTNGTLVRKRIDELVESGLGALSVSIDGMQGVHDALRGGRGGVFDEVRSGIELLRSRSSMKVDVYFVVTNRNVRDLVPVFDLARGLGASFAFWPVNGAADLFLREAADVKAFRKALHRIAERDPTVERRLPFYELGLAYHAGRAPRVRCLGLARQLGVDPEGNVGPCCVWGRHEFAVGNALDGHLADIWESPASRDLREKIFRRGCRGLCFNHSLYEFTEVTGLPFLLPEPAAAAEAPPARNAAGTEAAPPPLSAP